MVPILLCYNETLRFIELFDSGNGESHLLEIIDDWLPAIFITDGDHSDTTRATIEQKQREQKHWDTRESESVNVRACGLSVYWKLFIRLIRVSLLLQWQPNVLYGRMADGSIALYKQIVPFNSSVSRFLVRRTSREWDTSSVRKFQMKTKNNNYYHSTAHPSNLAK